MYPYTMTPNVDVLALYEHMRFELKTASHQNALKLKRKPRDLFNVVLGTVKKTCHLDDIEIRYIHSIASKLFESKSDSLQSLTFEFMKRLINIFATAKLRHKRGHIVTELLKFYTEVVFSSARQSKLFSKASQHAVELCSVLSPCRVYALRAFDLAGFAKFPLRRFKRDAVQNLLTITSQKVSSCTDLDHSVPAAIHFLSEVCEAHDRCHYRIKVCSALCQVLEVIAREKLWENFATLRSSNLFQSALSHVTYSKKNRSCWEAVAQLMKAAFKFADAPTKNLLVEIGVFQRAHEMFRYSYPNVIAQLSDFLTEVCGGPDLLYINHALNYNIIVLVVPFVEHPPHASNIQQRASRTLDTFLAKAEIDQIFRGLNYGMLPSMIRLLRSKNEQAVANALKWLFVSIEKLEGAKDVELIVKFKQSVLQLQANKALIELFAHKKVYISRSATITHERLVGSRKRHSRPDEARRLADRQYILESVFP